MRRKPNEFTTTKKATWINANGEVTTEYHERVIERYNSKGYLYKNRTDFLKSFTDELYPDELTWAEKGRLGRMEHEVKDDQMLVYKSGNVIKPHTIKTLANMLDCSPRQMTALIKKCKKLNVIGEAKVYGKKFYFLNPRYKLHGNRISMVVWIVFQDFFKATIPEYAYNYFLEDYMESPPDVQVIK